MQKIKLILILFPFCFFGQTEKNPCETLTIINGLIQENHYKPKPIDDSLSVYVFKNFLSRLDEENRLFIEPEIEKLKVHQYQIDDYINLKDCSFLNDFRVAYDKAVTRYSAIVNSLKNESFPTCSDEKIFFSKNAFPFVKEESELKSLYKKRILFNILREVSEMSTNKDSLDTHFDTLIAQAKAKFFDRYECKIQSLQHTDEEFNGLFYSAFCSYFDPHTEYFSKNEKNEFFSTVSSDNLTFGIYISMNEKDELTVSGIIPGSSAYSSERIDIGDKLLKINSNTKEYTIECAALKKIDEIINSNEPKIANFTFQKKSGEIYTVRLVKSIMKDFENTVFSYTIKKNNSTFGYIKIPSFYSLFENGKSSMCNDVVKEISKLKKDNIEGLLIDLEDNGGGSMQEAVRLSGLFIDSGPLAILKNNQNTIEILRDTEKGNIYDGPMIIMINGLTASASEFFTNAMQDYNRAIIVGNNSLGKATMQQVIPLNPENDAFLKLTLDEFYRVTGKSSQYSGILPDIEIPNLFDKQIPREKSNKTALKNDEINFVLKFKTASENSYVEAISISKQRIESSNDAKYILNLNNKINPLFDNELPPIDLQFDSVFYNVKEMNTLWKEIQTETKKEYPIIVDKNSVDLKKQKTDEFSKSFNKEQIKTIKQNYHILESVNILEDIVHMK